LAKRSAGRTSRHRKLPLVGHTRARSASGGALSKRTTVAVTREVGASALRLLERALDEAGFWTSLARVHRASRLNRRRFRIVIKPDFDFHDAPPVGGTDPSLVEHLIDLLHDRGFSNVVVSDGRNDDDSWLHNRESMVLAELVGYRFATSKAREYEIVDCRTSAAACTDSAANDAVPISEHWCSASYRINFAKNKTHEDSVFALCVRNLIGLTTCEKPTGTTRTTTVIDDCLEVLRRSPPDFNIIDAFDSCHGGAGQRAPCAMQTHTFIASESAVLADWAAAAKMGVETYAAPGTARGRRNIGLPPRHEIVGDLTPYALWRNVHPLIAHSARLRNQAALVGGATAPWFQSVDRERFPLKEFHNDRINSYVAPLMKSVDDNARSFWAIVIANWALARVAGWVAAQQTMFGKERLLRRVVPLTIDLPSFDEAAYSSIPGYLEPYERLLQDCPATPTGARWRQVDGSVLFSCSHVFPIPFAAFVKAVDVSRSIQYMNDYIGGTTVVRRRGSRGRVLQQAERNLYLQQPNWMALFGSDIIDVEKLEVIRYSKDREVLFWRTVRSPNGSATYDDGSLSLTRTDGGETTTLRIFARQKFTLPLVFQILDVDKVSGFRDPIIERAYNSFFAGTVANLQAVYEGREFRIGRAPFADGTERNDGGDIRRFLATAAAAVLDLLKQRGRTGDAIVRLFGTPSQPDVNAGRREADGDGFVHFQGAASGTTRRAAGVDELAMLSGMAKIVRDAPEFITDLADAMHKDLETMTRTERAQPQ
jgi:uncharacterized protein (DUF362 family)